MEVDVEVEEDDVVEEVDDVVEDEVDVEWSLTRSSWWRWLHTPGP